MRRFGSSLLALIFTAGALAAQTRPLSPFARAKAEALLRERLPCLGCHELDGEGGRIGPELSAVASRRSPQEIYSLIRDPQGNRPGTPMPKVPMPEGWRRLVASYLATRAGPTQGPPARAPAGPPTPNPSTQTDTGAALYAHKCAACHGRTGEGDGFNAPYLPVRPTAHADAAYMSTRSDDALYDAIAAGGYVMNRSPRMPAFGETLTRVQIRSLVRHLRTLCRCEGPAWSRDGQR